MERRQFLTSSLAASAITLANRTFGGVPSPMHPRDYDFRQRISREVLDNYLLAGDLDGGTAQRQRRSRRHTHARANRSEIQLAPRRLVVLETERHLRLAAWAMRSRL